MPFSFLHLCLLIFKQLGSFEHLKKKTKHVNNKNEVFINLQQNLQFIQLNHHSIIVRSSFTESYNSFKD